MKIIKTVAELETYVAECHAKGLRIGLVPTMGALHEGHLSLVKKARSENDIVIVSLFVNPTQFNNPTDLATYPKDLEADYRLLAPEKTDVAFSPDVIEMYPDGPVQVKTYELGPVAEVMEGPMRPGHFQGVAQIVDRLFKLVRPHNAYFGEKDFQQVAVIRAMVCSEHLDVNIVACPIKRAADGLALSSRNALLTPEQREIAPEIYATLKYSVEYSRQASVRATHDIVVERLNANPVLDVEYFEIVDARTLAPVEEWDEAPEIVGCITVYCGKIRLIDNIKYRPL